MEPAHRYMFSCTVCSCTRLPPPTPLAIHFQLDEKIMIDNVPEISNLCNDRLSLGQVMWLVGDQTRIIQIHSVWRRDSKAYHTGTPTMYFHYLYKPLPFVGKFSDSEMYSWSPRQCCTGCTISYKQCCIYLHESFPNSHGLNRSVWLEQSVSDRWSPNVSSVPS